MALLAELDDELVGVPAPRQRVQVEGDLFHGRVPDSALYVGRAAPGLPASPYANPHSTSPNGCRACGGQVHTTAEAVELYRARLRARPELVEQARRELAGRDLACWCRLPADWWAEPDLCHGAVLLDVVAGQSP
ncbi:DUF4326 domain-containing protein [Sphaerisporangium album]|uniref:DUF4326 domain-containing protein n=2 Tax=Sphaerisporangium album TaxID=509200 RepID=A0A367FHE0_9ACTN|nr:DUF4326 domain-containing protein [Sphaerisporangium album]